MRREYNLSVDDFNSTGRVFRPVDGTSVALNKLQIKKGEDYVSVHSYDLADMLLGAAICSCGKEVDKKRVCLLLEDGSVLYPALCCKEAVMFEGVVKPHDR